ncbi:MAG: Stp1/IreP family PP2C-type Ser/Thr phosphatase [Deltaproteobacteria bacterium]|nr:Stp1/IreP family PP2C-type Ser/Thr phosphatase [Deltaproteobacteria bacterium]
MRSRPKKKKRKQKRGLSVSNGRVSHWAKSDVGLRRELNEDSYLADSNLNLYVVADGMGGHAGGDTASRMAVDTVRQKVLDARKDSDLFTGQSAIDENPAILRTLNAAIGCASENIYKESSHNPNLEGMGTTITMIVTHGVRCYIAHVGDSRLYRLRSRQLELVTEDHSLVNEQIKAGFITAEEAAHSRFRNIITRSVGFESEVTADTMSVVMQPNDLFLLCSDGLNGMIDDEQIQKTINRGKLATVPARLIAAANKVGGEDNISVILVKYEEDLGGEVRRDQGKKRKKKRQKHAKKGRK